MQPSRKLLLWDIDGTLFLGRGSGARALRVALRDVFRIEGTLHGVELAGRTDSGIARQLLEANGVEPTAAAVVALFDGYIAALEAELARCDPSLLPGVLAALEAVAARADLAQGLLTGNLERGARLKLERFDVWRFFPFGAWGDDSHDRNHLGPHAVARASAHHAHPFEPGRTFVIGDTPHDIECGRAIGAFTIAVATGRHTVAELEAHQPTAVLPDLGNTAAFLALIDAHPARD